MKFQVIPRRLLIAASAIMSLLVVGAMSPSAMAQTVTATSSASNNLTCASDRFGSGLNCTAGEFTTIVTLNSPPSNPVTCVAGQTITVSGVVTLSGTNADRYDGAIFFGQSGNSPQTYNGGQCSVARFPTSSSALPPRVQGFINLDGDAAGDYRAGGVETWQVDNIKVVCQANTSGLLKVPYLLSYQQNDPGVVNNDSSSLLRPGSPSKCNAGEASFPTIVVQGYLDITKKTDPAGASGSFSFTAVGAGATPLTFNLSDGQTQRITIPLTGSSNVSLSVTETAANGWSTTADITCLNPTGGAASYVTTTPGSRQLVAQLNKDNYGASCTITNHRLPTLTLVKNVVNNNGGTAAASAWTLNATGPTNISGATGSATVTSAIVQPGTYALGETGGPTGYTASNYSCVKNAGAAVSGNSIALAYGDIATCTITNDDQPATLTLTKTVSNTHGGAQLASAWTLAATGPTSISGTTGSAAVTSAAVNSGTYTLSETGPANYTASAWSCSAGTLSGSSLTLANGQAATCSITNSDSNAADISITKTDNKASVTSGQATTYTLTASNVGPAWGNGSVIKDTPGSGLSSCAVTNCTSTGGASCPATPANVLTAGGATISTFPAGSTVVFTVQCTVN